MGEYGGNMGFRILQRGYVGIRRTCLGFHIRRIIVFWDL